MEKEALHNILDIFLNVKKAILNNDILTLRNLSNRTIHSSSIYQDEYSISIAVIVYSLSKIFERADYKSMDSWGIFYKACLNFIDGCISSLKRNDLASFSNSLKNFVNAINKLDKKLRDYVKQVIEDSKINKASRLYEHGISIGRTAELVGISAFELSEYIGNTGIAEHGISGKVIERLKFARGLFK